MSRWLQLLLAPGSGERGQTLLIMGLLLPFVFAVCAIIAVDVPFWQSERRRAQTAADLAALAAAREIIESGGDASDVRDVGQQYADANGYTDEDDDVNCGEPEGDGVQVCIDYPFEGDDDRVQVQIKSPSSGLFLGFFDAVAPDHGARAVAEVEDGGDGFLFFNNNDGCFDPDVLGIGSPSDQALNSVFVGDIHGNNGILIHENADDNAFTGEISFSEDGCFVNDGSGNTFDPNPDPDEPSPPADMPDVTLPDEDGSECDFLFTNDTELWNENSVWVDPGDKEALLPGVYCSEGDLELTGQGSQPVVTGNVTFIAGWGSDDPDESHQVVIRNVRPELEGLFDGLLFYTPSDDPNAIDILPDVEGDGDAVPDFQGTIYAPEGKVKLKASNYLANVAVIADRIFVSGTDNTYTAFDGGPSGVPRIKLDE